MLADWKRTPTFSGKLDGTIHLPKTSFMTLLKFIAQELPRWRDDPRRPARTAENRLTAQLCAHMNSASRLSPGWDFLQFRTEEPDETRELRRIDLVTAPRGITIIIEGREYSHYKFLFPIECKRLPTPAGARRDAREYLYSRFSSAGGVQRFKEGLHGAAHSFGAMIAYIQKKSIRSWLSTTRSWLEGLIAERTSNWEQADELHVVEMNDQQKTAQLSSSHNRINDLPPIELHHLWIEMNG